MTSYASELKEIKDSGKRVEFDSGMVRDIEDGKVKYDLVFDGPMFERWAAHLTAGAEKYDDRNWMKASGDAEMRRFKRSAARHFFQWFRGDRDEDHAAAVIFNLNGAEYVADKSGLFNEWTPPVKAEPAKYVSAPWVAEGEYARGEDGVNPLRHDDCAVRPAPFSGTPTECCKAWPPCADCATRADL